MADTFQVGDAIGEVRLRVGDRLVIDGGTDLRQAIVEQQAGLQVAELLVEVLGCLRDAMRRWRVSGEILIAM